MVNYGVERSSDLVEDGGKWQLKFLRSSKQQDERRLFDKRKDTNEDESRDEQRTDRVGNVPAKRLDEQRGHDDTDTTQGVSKNVQEHTCTQTIIHGHINSFTDD